MTTKTDTFNQIRDRIRNCENCLLAQTRNQPVPGEGNIDSEILFIGEGPGANENKTGRPFVGAAGKFLDSLIEIAGFKRSEVFITNVIKCRPPANRDPLPEELESCNAFLQEQIKLIDPVLIVTLGRFSMGMYFPFKKISAIHGSENVINNRIIVPMFHPAAALHQPALRSVLEKDFAKLPAILERARALRERAALEALLGEEAFVEFEEDPFEAFELEKSERAETEGSSMKDENTSEKSENDQDESGPDTGMQLSFF